MDKLSQAVEGSTGPAGNFTVRLPGPGKYLVTVTHEGFFQLREMPLEIPENARPAELVLNHLSELLQSIEVPGEPGGSDLDPNESQKTLTNLNILNIPYQGRDLIYSLKLMPGVAQDSQGGLHLSGSAVNQVLYTLDGFNITDPISGAITTRLNVDSVRSIQYSAGRYSPEYGKGSAGAVAIHTQMGTDLFQYNATNFVPGVDTVSGLHIGTWSPRFTFSGPIRKGRAWFSEAAEAAYSQRVVEDVNGPNRTPTLKFDNLLRTQINATKTNLLFASFLMNSSISRRGELSVLDPISTTTDRRSRTWFFSLKHDKYFSNGALVEWGYAEERASTLMNPQGDGLYEITPYGRRGHFFLNSVEHAGRRQFLVNLSPPAFHLGGAHQFKAGVDADQINYEVNNRRTGYELWRLDGTRLSQTTFAGNGAFYRPNREVSSYVLDSWKVKQNLVVEPGIRQDWDALLRNVVLSPRLSVSWSPFGWKNTKLTGGYAVTRDSTSLQEWSRPLDQYSLTTYYNSAGSVTLGPAATYYRLGAHNLATPRYRNWTAGLEQHLPHNIVLNGNYLRKRGTNGLTYLAVPFPSDPATLAVFDLMNYRRDVFDSAELTMRQSFGKQYEWMASYTRSRALSNSVLSLSVDQPVWVPNNVGRMPWDTPNRFLAWGYFPTPWRNWTLAALVEARDGFPFSVQTDYGLIMGEINSFRYPAYFDLDLHVERRLHLGKRYIALRGGFSNITNHRNPTAVNNVLGSPDFLNYYGSQGRHLVFRLRWLGKSEP